MATLAKSSAVAEVRNALARDLHDSVVQFLAGTMFRLEALRRRLRDGKDPEGEIEAMKDALRREQAQLRVMIDRLRRGEDGDRTSDITEELRSLVEEMAATGASA
jgi:signal transduction histidine kinase